MTTRNTHYVLSTHWDREWYQTFQDYRYRLVQLMDRILDGLDDGRLKGPFQTDGQAIILEDYLEIRPEQRDRIGRLAKEGKLVIGPWYVLPDEFLISGESHVRNLRLGREIAREFGATPSRAGFACDLFGHVSQLPQVFSGFGIDNAFLWRGVNMEAGRHFLWEGADGSQLVCFLFSGNGYSDFAFEVRGAGNPNEVFDAETVRQRLENYIEREAGAAVTDAVLLFDGGDHQEWDQEVYAVLAERMERPDGAFAVKHSSLDEYAAEMTAQRKRVTERRHGELREPGRTAGAAAHQIHGVLSSRVWIKQANAYCQTVLCHWAEPMTAFAHAALGIHVPHGFLNVAWKWLLKNHPHDSICGCSLDQVHEDMKFRFSQSRQIADRLTTEALTKITASVKGKTEDGLLRIGVFNPLPVPFEGTTEIDLEVPNGWPEFNEFFGYEPLPAFSLHDVNGKEVPFQRLCQERDRRAPRTFPAKFPQRKEFTRVRVSLPLEIPAMGYTTLMLKAEQPRKPHRHPNTPSLVTSDHSMENEHLRVEIQSNGAVNLTDKRTNQKYENLLVFEERADIGDGWFFGHAVNDRVFYSSAAHADVVCMENGPQVSSFRIRKIMRVPREFDFREMKRSEDRVEMEISTIIRLRPGSEHLEIETSVVNTAKDHRVRVLMPTGVRSNTFLSDTPFDVVERSVALRPDNHEYFELEVETKPQQSWTAVSDERRGLAVISTGLMEATVRDQPERPLALTLFRGTRRTEMTSGEPNGQILGPMTFRYALMPFAGQANRTRLSNLGQRIAAGLRVATVGPLDERTHRSETELPGEAGFLEVKGSVVVTSTRIVDGALEVRAFNPSSEVAKATISWEGRPASMRAFRKAHLVDLESKPVRGKLTVEKNRLDLAFKAKQILTIRLT